MFIWWKRFINTFGEYTGLRVWRSRKCEAGEKFKPQGKSNSLKQWDRRCVYLNSSSHFRALGSQLMGHFIPHDFAMSGAPLKLNLIFFARYCLNSMGVIRDISKKTLAALVSRFLKSL